MRCYQTYSLFFLIINYPIIIVQLLTWPLKLLPFSMQVASWTSVLFLMRNPYLCPCNLILFPILMVIIQERFSASGSHLPNYVSFLFRSQNLRLKTLFYYLWNFKLYT